MDQPLIGTPANNYRFFYCAGGGVVVSLVMLLIITIIVTVVVNDVQLTTGETRELVKDINELLPDARFGVDLLHLLCENKNFTNHYRNVRDVCLEYNPPQ